LFCGENRVFYQDTYQKWVG